MNTASSLTCHFLGLRVNALTKGELLDAIRCAVEKRADNCIIGNHNLHSVYLFNRDAELRRFYNRCLYTHIDGMSVILLARLFGLPLRTQHRTTYLDWFDEFLRLAERESWRIFFVGGTQEVSASLPGIVNGTYPGLKIRTHHGFDGFDPQSTVFEEINQFAPQVLIVGMGMPLQEKWIMHAVSRLQVNLILPCGAMMDYVAGVQKAPPRWLGQIGLEWLFRLVHRPSALGRRYLQEPLLLLPLMLKSIWKRERLVHDAWQSCPLCDSMALPPVEGTAAPVSQGLDGQYPVHLSRLQNVVNSETP